MTLTQELSAALTAVQGAPDPNACEWAVYGALIAREGATAPGLDRLAEHALMGWIRLRGASEGPIGLDQLHDLLADLQAPMGGNGVRWLRSETRPQFHAGAKVALLLSERFGPGVAHLGLGALRALTEFDRSEAGAEEALATVHTDLEAIYATLPAELLRQAIAAHEDGEELHLTASILRGLPTWADRRVTVWIEHAEMEVQGLDVEPLRAALKDMESKLC